MPISAATAAIAAPIAGAVIGGISGGKGKKTTTSENGTSSNTSTQSVNTPDKQVKMWDNLLQRGDKMATSPYPATVSTHVAPSQMYGGLFDNPEMQAIQNDKYNNVFAGLLNPQAEAAAPAAPDAAANDAQMGKEYFNNYGQKSGVNPAFFNTLNSQTMDYAKIGKLLRGVQDDPNSFNSANSELMGLGLGYSPEALKNIKGVTMPTSGIPGYN